MELPYDPVTPRLGILLYLKKPETQMQKNISILMFIAALFTIAKKWKQLKCPSIGDWIKSRGHVCDEILLGCKKMKSCHFQQHG